jgi:hypothetical protein
MIGHGASALRRSSESEPPDESPDAGRSIPESGGDWGAGSADRAGGLDDALRLAQRLTIALQQLQERERSAYRLDQETMERIRRLEQSAQKVAAVHRTLQQEVAVELSDEDLEMLASLLSAWVERPNDLLVMVKLAERSSALAEIVSAFREIRRLLSTLE